MFKILEYLFPAKGIPLKTPIAEFKERVKALKEQKA